MKLYEYAAEFAELFESLDDMGGDEELEQAWFDTLESIEADIMDKAENLAAYIKQLTAESAMLKAEEEALAARRKAKDNRAKRLKKYLLDCMNAASLAKIDRPMARVTVKNNAESVKIADEPAFVAWARSNADDLLTYAEPKISKTAVKDYIKAGHEIDGVTLERSQSVIIK